MVSNALIKHDSGAMALSEPDLLNVLASSLYPGAALDSIKLVIGYCKAAGLDPMLKPVHIVPMWDGKANRMRDVVMPGVNMYRIQASRSRQLAGMSEPEFGPEKVEMLGGQQVTYPEWCRVSVDRLMDNNSIARYTAVEYWIENYAIKGGKEKSIAPNAMWSKRPRGQIAKCAEAQALRKAFPEIASAPTADEMEGKSLHPDDDVVDVPLPPVALLKAARDAAGKGRDQFAAWWKEATPANRNLLRGHIDELQNIVAKREAPPADKPDNDFVAEMDAEETRMRGEEAP